MASSSRREAGMRVFSESPRKASHSSGSTVDRDLFSVSFDLAHFFPILSFLGTAGSLCFSHYNGCVSTLQETQWDFFHFF